jgi:transposase-like protein
MFTRIRKMLENDTKSLFGQIEVDETYIGGKRPGRRGRGAGGKSVVMGIVQRKGRAIVKVIDDVKAKTVLPVIQEHIPAPIGTQIYTDELASYNKLSSMGFTHDVILHSAKQYVNGTAHVNNVEGIWSHIKLGLTGVHRHVSSKYLQAYLDSYVYKYNHRKDTTPMFLRILSLIPYLTSEAA